MRDYKEMYYKLFNSITDALEILKEAQIETEEMFINSDEEDEKIRVLDFHKNKD